MIPTKPVGAGITSINISTLQRGKLRLVEVRAWPDHLTPWTPARTEWIPPSRDQPSGPELKFKFCHFISSGLPPCASVSPILQLREAKSWTQLSDFTFTFHFHALEKAMATHSSVLARRIPGTGEPGGLPSMGSHRVRHDGSNLAAAVKKRS